jgi:alginate O-acetyltransferase complex protein AlgI
MLFNSLTFLLLHAAVVLLYWLSPWQRVRLVLLLCASVIFYGWLYWPGLILLGTSILINFGFSRLIARRREIKVLAGAIVANLAVLAWFKYSVFFLTSLQRFFTWLGLGVHVPTPDLWSILLDLAQAGLAFAGLPAQIPHAPYWLPLGISFYTFQVMGYLVDVYRGEVEVEKSFLRFSVFKCFYAQLIAGPIVRGREMLPQLRVKAAFKAELFQKGFFLLLAGLCIKICVADLLAQFVVYAFDHTASIGTLRAWLSLWAFSFQILSDFWGYSTIAIGLGLMLGITLPVNFRDPYGAFSLQDFWRRWHITLSQWFRDYLYIPLGGNVSTKRMYLNLLLTMTIAGIWHGAGWAFLIWGFGHGLWLALERRFNRHRVAEPGRAMRFLRAFAVFQGVSLLWVFFRAKDLDHALAYLGKLLLPPWSLNAPHVESLLVILLIFGLFSRRLGKLFEGDAFTSLPLAKQAGLSILLILLIFAYADSRLDFIYFVF